MPFSKQLFNNFAGHSMQVDEMSDLVSNYKPQYDDDVMECLQFGICSKPSFLKKDFPSFHF
tara:strand:- start:210 stop:392 length:183 start_codon:yes stop_codon:yes gene_type:complete